MVTIPRLALEVLSDEADEKMHSLHVLIAQYAPGWNYSFLESQSVDFICISLVSSFIASNFKAPQLETQPSSRVLCHL